MGKLTETLWGLALKGLGFVALETNTRFLQLKKNLWNFLRENIVDCGFVRFKESLFRKYEICFENLKNTFFVSVQCCKLW